MNRIKKNSIFKKTLVASLVFGACTVGAADNRYIIKLKPGLDGDVTPFSLMSDHQRIEREQNNRQRIEKLGGNVKRSLIHSNSLAAELSAKQLAELRLSNIAELIEEDPRRYLIEPVATSTITPMAESTPYGITMVQALELSDANSASRKVCITDTGYTGNHEDLRAYTGNNISGNANDGLGNDTGNWYEDGHGHGTHVAGTISAHGNNGIGVIGVNRSNQIGLHIVKVFNNSGQWGYGSDLVAAVNQCVDAGANIISMSLGGGESSNAERNAFENAYQAGVLSIAASGNDGTSSGNDALSYPASYDVVMSVGAVDSNKRVSSWSQKNSQVEIAAPGVNVRSTLPNNAYDSWSGTSMATPHVSGVAALVWSNHLECSVAEIRNAINASAEDLGLSGRDNSYGYGLLKAKDASDYIDANACGGGPVTYPPSASFSESCANMSCDFDASASNDPDGTIESYSWDFGDGSTGSGVAPSHTYAADGAFNVVLTVTDNDGSSDSETKTVNIGSQPGDSFEDTDLSAWWWGWNRKTIEVPQGMSSLTISTSGGAGSVDLYLKLGSQPTTSSFTCRSNTSGNGENCTISNPQAGTWHIGLKASGFYFSGVTLNGEWY